MSETIIKKDGTDYPLQTMPLHYPADRVYLDGDVNKTVQDEIDNLESKNNVGELTGVTNTTAKTFEIPAKGMWLVTLQLNTSNTNSAGSQYLAFHGCLTPIVEGTNSKAPRMTLSGDTASVTLNSDTTGRTIYYYLNKLN